MRNGKWLLKGTGFFGGGDKNVLKFESGAQPYSTKYTLKGWIVWCVNYISIKFLCIFFKNWVIEASKIVKGVVNLWETEIWKSIYGLTFCFKILTRMTKIFLLLMVLFHLKYSFCKLLLQNISRKRKYVTKPMDHLPNFVRTQYSIISASVRSPII